MDMFIRAIKDPVAPLLGAVLLVFLIMEGYKIYKFFKDRLDSYHGKKTKEETFTEKVEDLSEKTNEQEESLHAIGTTLEGINSELKEIRSDVTSLKVDREETLNYRKIQEKHDAAVTNMDLSMSRMMLYSAYEKCMDKGFYTVAEREVYHALFLSYKGAGGDGVMDDLAEKIIALPTEPPKKK